MEREIYDQIFVDVKNQIDAWIDEGKTPETCHFKKPFWSYVGKDMAKFLCGVRGLAWTEDFSLKISEDIREWHNKKKQKLLSAKV